MLRPYWHLDDGADTDKLPPWQAWTFGIVIVVLVVLALLTAFGL